jgi:hypothetical protein
MKDHCTISIMTFLIISILVVGPFFTRTDMQYTKWWSIVYCYIFVSLYAIFSFLEEIVKALKLLYERCSHDFLMQLVKKLLLIVHCIPTINKHFCVSLAFTFFFVLSGNTEFFIFYSRHVSSNTVLVLDLGLECLSYETIRTKFTECNRI